MVDYLDLLLCVVIQHLYDHQLIHDLLKNVKKKNHDHYRHLIMTSLVLAHVKMILDVEVSDADKMKNKLSYFALSRKLVQPGFGKLLKFVLQQYIFFDWEDLKAAIFDHQ